MLQYKVPQDVGIEDKIVGPLTLRHLIILGVGGGIAYFLYITLIKNYYMEIWLPPVALISIITLAIAFLRIQHISFSKWVLLMIESAMLPHKRIWDKRESTQFLFSHSISKKKTTEGKKKQVEERALKKEKQASQLEELTKTLDFSSMISDEKEKSHLSQTEDKNLAAAALHPEKTYQKRQDSLTSLDS